LICACFTLPLTALISQRAGVVEVKAL
jgi:hypothetical protein